jgi:hypothetical protein
MGDDQDQPDREPDHAPPGAGTGEDPGASAPGLGVLDDDHELDEAPEPSEPA